MCRELGVDGDIRPASVRGGIRISRTAQTAGPLLHGKPIGENVITAINLVKCSAACSLGLLVAR